MIIGTQNSATMAGRRAPSTALARRLIKCYLSPYTQKELVELLIHRGLLEEDAKLLAEFYDKKYQYAIKHQLTPAPTFRDLLKVADRHRSLAQTQSQTNPSITTTVIETNYEEQLKLLEQIIPLIPSQEIQKAAIGVKDLIIELHQNNETPSHLASLLENTTQLFTAPSEIIFAERLHRYNAIAENINQNEGFYLKRLLGISMMVLSACCLIVAAVLTWPLINLVGVVAATTCSLTFGAGAYLFFKTTPSPIYETIHEFNGLMQS